MEDDPRPMVGKAGSAGGRQAVEVRGEDVRSSMGEKQGASSASGQVAAETIRGVSAPDDGLMPGSPGGRGALGGEVEILDVEGEDFVCSGGGVIEHPPECPVPKGDVGTGPQGGEVVGRDGSRSAAGLTAGFEGDGGLGQPAVALAVRDEGSEGGHLSVPTGLRRPGPALLEDLP